MIRRGWFAAVLAQVACLPPVPPLEVHDSETGSTTQPDVARGTDSSDGDPEAAEDTQAPPGDTTSTSDDTSSGEPSDETTTGDEPLCCYGGCEGSCVDGRCEELTLGSPFPDEAASIVSAAMVGDYVVWSTGWTRTLEIYEPGIGSRTLANVFSNGAVTMVHADEEHVYFLDWGGPSLRRAAVPGGGVDFVSEVPGVDIRAGFGSLTADRTHVYFAMQGSGGIWRAAKDLSQPVAELVVEAARPAGIGISQGHLLWSIDEEGGLDAVFRLALTDVGTEVSPEMVYDGGAIMGLVADDEGLFIVDDGIVLGIDPFGTNEGIVYISNNESWVPGLALDAAHVYWTGGSSENVSRARRDGSGGVETISAAVLPSAVALSCDTVYWLSQSDLSLHSRLK